MSQKTILCYGDSNTYGTIPWTGKAERYDETQRWTRLLEAQLGSGFRVIEEGLPSRTIDLDAGKNVNLNGIAIFGSILYSHLPLDWIILCLGTNDTKTRFAQSPEKMIEGIEKYLSLIEKNSPNSEVLLVAPVPVNENIANNSYTPNSWIGANQKAKDFTLLLGKLALKRKTKFLDLSKVIQVSLVDGIHFDLHNQESIANAINQIILNKYLN
jgi:lysophospholipase L1-like esterase